MDDYVPKPVKPEEHAAVLERWVPNMDEDEASVFEAGEGSTIPEVGRHMSRTLRRTASTAQLEEKWSQPERPSTGSPPRSKITPLSVTSPIKVTGTSTLAARAFRTGSGAAISSS